MTKPTNKGAWIAIAVAIGTSLMVTMTRGKDEAKKKPDPAATTAAAAAPAAAELGDPATAQWTATTHEAAASEANKQVLASGKQATVTGEVVDVSCYLQLGKRGEAHVACGSKCIAAGEPIGIVDAQDNLYMVFAEEHHPRRDGTVGLEKTVGSLLAKNVTLTGMLTENKGYRALFVQAAEIDSVMSRATSEGK